LYIDFGAKLQRKMKNEELKVKNTHEKTYFLLYVSQFQILFVLLPNKKHISSKPER